MSALDLHHLIPDFIATHYAFLWLVWGVFFVQFITTCDIIIAEGVVVVGFNAWQPKSGDGFLVK
jgi:hypothetical protein